MKNFEVSNNALIRSKYVPLMVLFVLYSCNSNNEKTKSDKIAETEAEITNRSSVTEKHEKLDIRPVGSDGIAMVLGKEIKFYNKNLIESDSIPFNGEVFSVLEISQDKYPKSDANHCIQFPYLHISNSRLTGWINGKYVYRIFDKPERTIEISNKPYLIYKSKNFGVGAIDSFGKATGCEEYYPILLRTNDTNNYHIIDLKGGNPIYNNIQFQVLNIYDEIKEISSDSISTIIKIKTEDMEGGYNYDLKLRRLENGMIVGEITNVTEWVY